MAVKALLGAQVWGHTRCWVMWWNKSRSCLFQHENTRPESAHQRNTMCCLKKSQCLLSSIKHAPSPDVNQTLIIIIIIIFTNFNCLNFSSFCLIAIFLRQTKIKYMDFFFGGGGYHLTVFEKKIKQKKAMSCKCLKFIPVNITFHN